MYIPCELWWADEGCDAKLVCCPCSAQAILPKSQANLWRPSKFERLQLILWVAFCILLVKELLVSPVTTLPHVHLSDCCVHLLNFKYNCENLWKKLPDHDFAAGAMRGSEGQLWSHLGIIGSIPLVCHGWQQPVLLARASLIPSGTFAWYSRIALYLVSKHRSKMFFHSHLFHPVPVSRPIPCSNLTFKVFLEWANLGEQVGSLLSRACDPSQELAPSLLVDQVLLQQAHVSAVGNKRDQLLIGAVVRLLEKAKKKAVLPKKEPRKLQQARVIYERLSGHPAIASILPSCQSCHLANPAILPSCLSCQMITAILLCCSWHLAAA